MIVKRLKSFFQWFEIGRERQHELEVLAHEAAYLSEGMTHLHDYLALGAILEATQPRLIFEIGTYKGVTADFFMRVLPNCQVVSIAFINPKRRELFKKKFNNSELTEKEVGSLIAPRHQERFTQLLGNSHALIGKEMVSQYGQMDLVFIDGDHSVGGVKLDTALTLEMIHENSTICWHDANPKEKYFPVRRYLERELEKPAIATNDDYIGGVACWNSQIEKRLKQKIYA